MGGCSANWIHKEHANPVVILLGQFAEGSGEWRSPQTPPATPTPSATPTLDKRALGASPSIPSPAKKAAMSHSKAELATPILGALPEPIPVIPMPTTY